LDGILPTVIIETHGCKLNQADSQALARRFVQSGYQVVDSNQPADVYVLDTCTVTQLADRKARRTLRAARRCNPKALIVATGCYAQRDHAALEAIPEIDLVLGNTDKSKLVNEVVSLRQEEISPCTVGEEVADRMVHRARAMVKIQEGCNQICTYCIVPKVRGRERSIPAETLVAQILALENEGFKEVVLTGTQLISYGFDIRGYSLARLLETVLTKTTIPRIRVSSLQPQVLDKELLELWQDTRLCPHFHMPLQSGSDTVLHRMGRRYSAEFFANTIERIRAQNPSTSVTTDVLTGFPGESDDEFQETYLLCQNIRFSGMHVFPYSVRPGTSAAHFNDKVDPITKGQRGKLLAELAGKHANDFLESLLGQTRSVLWEREATGRWKGYWSGLTDNYVRVYAEDQRPLRNTITETKLLRQHDGFLYGSVIR